MLKSSIERTSLGTVERDAIRDRVRRCVRDGGTRDRRARPRGSEAKPARRAAPVAPSRSRSRVAPLPTTTTRAHQSGRQDRARLSRRGGADVVSRCGGQARWLLGRAVQPSRGCDEERAVAAVARRRVGRGRRRLRRRASSTRRLVCAADEVTLAHRVESVVLDSDVSGRRLGARPYGCAGAVAARARGAPEAVRAVVARHAAADASTSHVFGAGRFRDDRGVEGAHRRAAADRERRARSTTTTPGSRRSLQRRSDVLFGDRAQLLQAVQHSPDGKYLRVLIAALHVRAHRARAGAQRRRLPSRGRSGVDGHQCRPAIRRAVYGKLRSHPMLIQSHSLGRLAFRSKALGPAVGAVG